MHSNSNRELAKQQQQQQQQEQQQQENMKAIKN